YPRTLLFFFQAEDGIRDLTVTGVQTCALPISVVSTATAEGFYPAPAAVAVDTTGAGDALAAGYLVGGPERAMQAAASAIGLIGEIGRASCRERVLVVGVVGSAYAE